MSAAFLRHMLLACALLLCAALGCSSDDDADAAGEGGGAAGDGDGDGDAQATTDGGLASDGDAAGDGDGQRTGDGDGDAQATTMPGDPALLIGTFTVELIEEDAATGAPPLASMVGFVRDAPVIASMLWDFEQEAGDCVLEVPRFPFCDPDCGAGQSCVEDDLCIDEPVGVDVGTVTVSGLSTNEGGADFELMRIGASYQPSRSLDIRYPPADEGAEVRIAAAGGDVAPFEITTRGIAPLDVDAGESVPAEREMPLSLSWQPPGANASSTARAVVDVSHHGGSRGRIVCELDDAGALEIDAALVTALLDLGTAGFPTVKLTRRAVGSTVIEHGRVELSVEQSIELPLSIPGLVSCTDSAECPDGQSCQSTRKCG
jgi:hypothetical protein